MTPAELRRLLEPLDPAGTVTVGWLLAHLDADADGIRSTYAIAGQERTLPPVDLDVKAFAARMQRSPSTCRAWLEHGRVEGAYQARGRWRIPLSAVAAFEEQERQPKPPAPGPRGKHDLSTWRRSA